MADPRAAIAQLLAEISIDLFRVSVEGCPPAGLCRALSIASLLGIAVCSAVLRIAMGPRWLVVGLVFFQLMALLVSIDCVWLWIRYPSFWRHHAVSLIVSLVALGAPALVWL